MSKRFLLHDYAKLSAPKQAKTVPDINWSLCMFCQKISEEKVTYPYKNLSGPTCIGYKTLDEDISLFKSIGVDNIDIQRLDDGSGIEETVKKNETIWHKTCRAKYSKSRFERLLKQQSKDEVQHCVRSHQREKISTNSDVCFFCDKKATESESLQLVPPLQYL